MHHIWYLDFPVSYETDIQTIVNWNRLCDPIDANTEDLLADVLKHHRFQRRHWIWRPAWYWPGINSDERILEVKDPWAVKDVDWGVLRERFSICTHGIR